VRIDHRVKYLTLVVIPSILLVIIGGSRYCHYIDQTFAIVVFGGPLIIYFGLARAFHAGEIFNIFLLFFVSAGYLAILFAPLLYIFRSFKWSLLTLQATLFAIHLLLGAVFT